MSVAELWPPDAIVVEVLPSRDAARRRELVGGIGAEHVRSQLQNEHAPVPVEGDRAGLLDALIVAVGAGLLSWTFLMAPIVADSAQFVTSRSNVTV